ncbi:MAG: hypothetical protein KF803_05435 [Cyclobacteriaceae bacterium]|nr:hypothetical protein [Cyclobacteriaceae bacterium]
MRLSFFSLLIILVSCTEKDSVNYYYSSTERDSLLTDIITYIYVQPQQATWQSRFDQQFRKYYVSQLSKFNFEKYWVADDGWHYYYIIRPARSAQGTIRGVGGRLKLDENKSISEFEEIFNTPVGDLPELRTKGNELFKWMIKHGHINEYVNNPDFVEWPNEQTYYDTVRHEWLIRPGL